MSIVSKKLRGSAGHHDAHCMLQIAGVCGDATTSKAAGCVLAHIRYGNAGFGQKPHDIHGVFACGPCHEAFDSNGVKGLTRGSEEWLHYALRGQQLTQDWWHQHGFLTIKGEK